MRPDDESVLIPSPPISRPERTLRENNNNYDSNLCAGGIKKDSPILVRLQYNHFVYENTVVNNRKTSRFPTPTTPETTPETIRERSSRADDRRARWGTKTLPPDKYIQPPPPRKDGDCRLGRNTFENYSE